MKQRPIFEFYGEIYKVETKRDGGGRLYIDFGADSLIPIQLIQRMQVNNDITFAFAFVPWYPDEEKPRVSFTEDPPTEDDQHTD